MRPCTIALSRLHPPRRKAFGRLPRPPTGLTSPKSILHWSTCTPLTLVSGLERFLALSLRISLRRPGKTPDVLCPLLRYRPAPQFPRNNIAFAQRTPCGGIEAAACGCECVDQHPFRAITFPLRNGRCAAKSKQRPVNANSDLPPLAPLDFNLPTYLPVALSGRTVLASPPYRYRVLF